MKNIAGSFCLGAALAVMAGCNPVPPATGISHQAQEKIQATQHWQTIARHLAGKIATSSDRSDEPFYIANEGRQGVFGRVFADMITSELLASGVRVSEHPDNALTISYDVETVRQPSDRDGQYPWLFSAATATYYLIDGLAGDAAAVMAVGADVARLQPSRTRTELAITTRVTDRGQVLFSETGVYYITDHSASHYLGGDRGGKTFRVTDDNE